MADFTKLRQQQRLLNDTSNIGRQRYQIAKIAFENCYDPTRKFDDLNPLVQEDWLQKTDAIMRVLQEKKA